MSAVIGEPQESFLSPRYYSPYSHIHGVQTAAFMLVNQKREYAITNQI
jgi:hypothetical protein